MTEALPEAGLVHIETEDNKSGFKVFILEEKL